MIFVIDHLTILTPDLLSIPSYFSKFNSNLIEIKQLSLYLIRPFLFIPLFFLPNTFFYQIFLQLHLSYLVLSTFYDFMSYLYELRAENSLLMETFNFIDQHLNFLFSINLTSAG